MPGLQREQAGLAFGLLERPIVRGLVGWLAFKAMPAGGQKVLPPGGQPVRLDLELTGHLLKRFATQQPQYRAGPLLADQRGSDR